jgi:hypothetical protein
MPNIVSVKSNKAFINLQGQYPAGNLCERLGSSLLRFSDLATLVEK